MWRIARNYIRKDFQAEVTVGKAPKAKVAGVSMKQIRPEWPWSVENKKWWALGWMDTFNGGMVGRLIISQENYLKKKKIPWAEPDDGDLVNHPQEENLILTWQRGSFVRDWCAGICCWGGKEWRCKVGVGVLGWQWDGSEVRGEGEWSRDHLDD